MRKRAIGVSAYTCLPQNRARLGPGQVRYRLDLIISMCKSACCSASAHTLGIESAKLCLLTHLLQAPHGSSLATFRCASPKVDSSSGQSPKKPKAAHKHVGLTSQQSQDG